MQDKEIWKDIQGYEGIYQASTSGKIKRLSAARGTNPGYIFKPAKDGRGYLRTRLTNVKASTVKIHRIIAQTFIPNPLNLPQVNHKNGIKTDNNVHNLEWCDNDFNVAHAVKNNLMGKPFLNKFGADHNKSIPIKATNIDTGEERVFHGTYEAARELKTNIGSIWRVRKGIYKHTKRWSFELY